MVTMARPPGNQPTTALANATSRWAVFDSAST